MTRYSTPCGDSQRPPSPTSPGCRGAGSPGTSRGGFSTRPISPDGPRAWRTPRTRATGGFLVAGRARRGMNHRYWNVRALDTVRSRRPESREKQPFREASYGAPRRSGGRPRRLPRLPHRCLHLPLRGQHLRRRGRGARRGGGGAHARGRARDGVPLRLLRPRPGPDRGEDPGAGARPRGRGRLLADPPPDDLPADDRPRRPQPVPLRARERPRAGLVGRRGPRGGDARRPRASCARPSTRAAHLVPLDKRRIPIQPSALVIGGGRGGARGRARPRAARDEGDARREPPVPRRADGPAPHALPDRRERAGPARRAHPGDACANRGSRC